MKMKYLFSLGCVILTFFADKTAYCQNSFAPVGAEWWYYSSFTEYQGLPQYSTTNSTFHTRSVADTVIDGVSCRKVTTEIHSVSNGSFTPHARDYFFYDNTDTVFVYNENFNRFTPLFVFNALEGDTVCLPVPPTLGGADLRMNPISGDTSFCFVVDSIRTLMYDTAHLRTVFIHPLVAPGNDPIVPFAYPAYNWGNGAWYGDPVVGKYTERIIGDFLPVKMFTCADCYSFNYAPYDGLRCYSDNLYSLKLVPEACDTIYPLVIRTPQAADNILELYPNPADDVLNIALNQPLNEELRVTVMDPSGRVVLETALPRKKQHLRLALQAWAGGMYFLQFHTSGQVYYDKIVIRR